MSNSREPVYERLAGERLRDEWSADEDVARKGGGRPRRGRDTNRVRKDQAASRRGCLAKVRQPSSFETKRAAKWLVEIAGYLSTRAWHSPKLIFLA